jgi:hypothetical protein
MASFDADFLYHIWWNTVSSFGIQTCRQTDRQDLPPCVHFRYLEQKKKRIIMRTYCFLFRILLFMLFNERWSNCKDQMRGVKSQKGIRLVVDCAPGWDLRFSRRRRWYLGGFWRRVDWGVDTDVSGGTDVLFQDRKHSRWRFWRDGVGLRRAWSLAEVRKRTLLVKS